MSERCAMRDCIAPSARTVTDGNDRYEFCLGHFEWFERYLSSIRVVRDSLVDDGVDFEMANRIVQERVARGEL